MASEGQVCVGNEDELESLWLCFSMSEQLQSVFRDYKLLKTLMVIGQAISSLTGIEELKNLEELWLVDAGLQQQNILHISECPRLRRLYLYGNELTAIPALGHLDRLTHLWLSDNQIDTLQNLDSLPSVQELNLGNNYISKIDIKSKLLLQIEYLNISGNPIKSFDELEKLVTLRKLKTLILWDPLFRRTAVTLLDNYRPHVIYCLPGLSCLDTVVITEAERNQIQTFYETKEQFYSLTLHNELSNLWTTHQSALNLQNRELRTVWSALHSHGPVDFKTAKKSTFLRFWEDEAQRWKERRDLSLQHYQAVAEVITEELQMELRSSGNIRFEGINVMMLKQKFDAFLCNKLKEKLLGVDIQNVWAIHGPHTTAVLRAQSSDDWDNVYILGCVQDVSIRPLELVDRLVLGTEMEEEVVLSSCMAAADSLVKDSATVHRLMLLRSHTLHRSRMALLAQGSYRQVLSSPGLLSTTAYVIVSGGSAVLGSLPIHLTGTVIEHKIHGYVASKDYFKPKKKTGVPTATLGNGASVIQHTSAQHLTQLVLTCANLQHLDIPVMQHVSMVNLSYNYLQDLSSISVIFPKLSFLNISFNRISSLDSLQNTTHLKHLVVAWNSLKYFLPTVKKIKELASVKHLELSYNPFQDVLSGQQQLFLVCRHLGSLLSYNGRPLSERSISDQATLWDYNQFHKVPGWRGPRHPLTMRCKLRQSGSWGKNSLGVVGTQVTNITLRNLKLTQIRSAFSLYNLKLLDLTGNLISDLTVLKNLLLLEELNLSFNVIERLTCPAKSFENLTKLNLSHNYITALADFDSQSFTNLKVLDLSNNLIHSLLGLCGLASLVELYLSHNLLRDCEALALHSKVLAWQNLKVLDLSFNPFPCSNSVRHTCLYYLPEIKYINGSRVEEVERKRALSLHGELLDEDYLIRVYNKPKLLHLTHISLTNCSIKKVARFNISFVNVTSVNLDHNKISELSWVQMFPNLTRLSLSHNRVCSFSLHYVSTMPRPMTALSTLLLDHNSISSLPQLNLELFPNLKLLALNNNQISSLHGLKDMFHLEQLILDRNKIITISANQTLDLENLLELYLEHNSLTKLDFIKPLKKLRRLFIGFNKFLTRGSLSLLSELEDLRELTVHGNPLFRHTHSYRNYLPDLPSLQLLEGHPIVMH